MRRESSLVACLLSLWAGACASAPEITPREDAIHRGSAIVDEAAARGLSESEKLERFTVPARFNPARCDCPDFEVFVYGRWVRVYLDGSESELQKLDEAARARDAIDDEALLSVEGRLTRNRRSRQRISYPVFELTVSP